LEIQTVEIRVISLKDRQFNSFNFVYIHVLWSIAEAFNILLLSSLDFAVEMNSLLQIFHRYAATLETHMKNLGLRHMPPNLQAMDPKQTSKLTIQ
jgi:hypothetical protein